VEVSEEAAPVLHRTQGQTQDRNPQEAEQTGEGARCWTCAYDPEVEAEPEFEEEHKENFVCDHEKKVGKGLEQQERMELVAEEEETSVVAQARAKDQL